MLASVATIPSFSRHFSQQNNLSFLSLMALHFAAKIGSLSTRVDRFLIPNKEHPVEIDIVNEVAALRLHPGCSHRAIGGRADPASGPRSVVLEQMLTQVRQQDEA
jgi:hypothetical protein